MHVEVFSCKQTPRARCSGTFSPRLQQGLFLLRIAVKRAHILTIHIMNGATILLSVAYFFVFIFQCNPVSSFWTIKPNNEHCLPIEAIAGISYGAAALGSVSDWTFGQQSFGNVLPYAG